MEWSLYFCQRSQRISVLMDKKSYKVLLQSLSQSARKLLPLTFLKTDPDSDEDSLRIYRERDAQNNRETTPPDSEAIELSCIWAVEFFTPSHTDALLTGVQRFGWNQDGFRSLRDIEEYVVESGELVPGVRGGWLNLGFVSESGTNDMTFSQPHPDARPPNHIRRVGGRLISITPSLFCVLMVFVLDDDYAKKLDSALRKDRQTFSKSNSHFSTIVEPERQKIDEIRLIRDEIKKIATHWFSLNLPGLFSSRLLEGEMPTCELITLRDAEPFATPRPSNSYFLRLLGLDFSYDAWSSTDIPGLKMSLQDMVDTTPKYHSILSIKESNLSDESLEESMGWSGQEARTLYINESVNDGLVHLWALLMLLEGYGNYLRSIRDSATLKPGPYLNTVNILDKLAGNVSFSIDIDAVTSELQSFAEPESRQRLRLPTFKPVESQIYPEGYTLAESLCTAIAKRASWIQKTDRSLRDHGAQYGALLGAMENVRIQQEVNRFTCVLVVLTIILTIVTILLMVLTIILGWETLEELFTMSKIYEWLQNVWMIRKILF